MNEQVKIKVTEKNTLRLDKFLTSSLKDLSRTKIQSLIKKGNVHVNGNLTKDISFKIKQDDTIEIELLPPVSKEIKGKKIKLDIVYEDKYLAVINKPAGLTVHPGAGNHDDTLVNGLIAHYKKNLSSISGQERVGIVHRLDRNTSGLLLIAKDDITHLKLSKLLQDREIKRIYNAIVWGTTEKAQGDVEINIGRSLKDRKKMSTRVTGGKHAVTHYKILKVFQNRAASLLECELETGRTHQIRVHLSYIGHPIIGDPEYGSMRTKRIQQLSESAAIFIRTLPRQMLHAKRIIFNHPITNKKIDLNVDLSEDIKQLIDKLSK